MKFLALLLALVVAPTSGRQKNYSGYGVVRVTPGSTEHLRLLASLESADGKVTFWRPPSVIGRDVDIQVAPDVLDEVRQTLQNAGLEVTVIIENIKKLIDSNERTNKVRKELWGQKKVTRDLDTSRYYDLAEMQAWLDDTAGQCLDCEIFSAGTSYEGRDLKIIKVGRQGTGRRSIFMDAGIHAREWIAPATLNYIINWLIEQDGVDQNVTQLLDTFDWYFLSVVNPDGYDYSWTSDRMWRKTRSPNAGSSCMGTDGNRNYDMMWDLAGGASDNPCSETFRGESAASEVEVSQTQAFVQSLGPGVDLAISLHSYSQILLHPWAYTTSDPIDLQDLETLAAIGVDAMNSASDVTYVFGKTSNSASGLSMDWTKGIKGVKFAYTLELRDDGTYGFLLPPDFIEPSGVEVWAGVQAMALALV